MQKEYLSYQKYLMKRNKLNEKEINFLKEVFEKKHYSNRETILKKGNISNYLYFIEKGILNTCFVNEEGKEFINGIAIENNFCTSVASFTHQTPSSEEIIALEDCEIHAISYENFQLLLRTFPIFKEAYIKILHEYLTFMTWRIESVSLLNAKQKYESLMQIYPKLFLRLPNKIMANYLGISQETLSRMKSAK